MPRQLSEYTIKKRDLDLKDKEISIKEKEVSMRKTESDMEKQVEDSKLEKCYRLQSLLQDITIDPNNTVLSSEPKLRPVIEDEDDRRLILKKLIQIIKDL